VGLLLARGATLQADTTGSVYNSSTRQAVRRISRGEIFRCRASRIYRCARFWQQSSITRTHRLTGANMSSVKMICEWNPNPF